jgi:hypothetical protein
MRSALGIALAAAALVTAAAPGSAEADCRPPAADRATQSRNVRGFHEIDLSAPARLVLKQGARESLTMTTDRRLLPVIRTTVRNGRLDIDWDDRSRHDRRDWDCMHDTVIEVTFVRLSDLMVSGAGSVEAGSVSGKELDIDLSGAGSVRIGRLSVTTLDVDITGAGSLTASGQAARQEIEISGAGSYSGQRVTGRDVEVDISGTGSAKVNASASLDVDISGMGSVQYSGNPRIRQDISGMGSLARLR